MSVEGPATAVAATRTPASHTSRRRPSARPAARRRDAPQHVGVQRRRRRRRRGLIVGAKVAVRSTVRSTAGWRGRPADTTSGLSHVGDATSSGLKRCGAGAASTAWERAAAECRPAPCYVSCCHRRRRRRQCLRTRRARHVVTRCGVLVERRHVTTASVDVARRTCI